MTATRSSIQVMPPDLALKIAAGEVVERPASAVKELVDNAVDAGAHTVKVDIREAGLKSIRVWDDGCGMHRDELPLAFTSHATSKITSLDDLEHLTTLGFRGEALPSIAAVARVDVQTRSAEEATGARYAVEFGTPTSQGACSASVGTRVTVSDLFANVPARRKFVRSLRAEAAHIATVVMQYALAQPAVHFMLTVDGRLAFESPGNGRLSDAVAAVHGADAIPALCPLEFEEANVLVEGLVSAPGLTRSNRSGINFFVNGRPVQNRSLVFALEEAYSGFLMVGRHPIAAVHLRVPPGDVDVNIHPSKSEVRFARDREVHGALHRGVANALLERRMQSRELDAAAETESGAPVLLNQPHLGVEEDEPAASEFPSWLPALRVFGQTNATFIIAEGPRGLYMIDQHTAHERILFDRLEEELTGGQVRSQPLLEPASLPLTPEQMQTLEVNAPLLSGVGFELEPFGDAACLVRSIPAAAGRGNPADLVVEVLGELQSVPQASSAQERALAAMACKAAVKAGQVLDVQEMREIVTQLERTRRPNTCPHGRPTMIHLSHAQLEREFGRR